MFDGRDALSSCQPAGSLLSLQFANFDKDACAAWLIKMCCVMAAVLEWAVPDPVPYRSIPVPDPDQPCTTPDPLSGEQMAGSHIEV